MRPIKLLQLTCLAVLMFGTQPLHAQSQGDKPMDHSQIQLTIDSNNAAIAAKDIDGILATYDPNAVMSGPRGELSAGTPALREAFKQFLAINPKITVTSSKVLQSGDVALHIYAWQLSGKAPDGTAIAQTGLSTIVLRKQPDGRWLMVIDNPFADQLLQKK